MLEKDFSLDGIFIVFFRLFLFSSPPLQFDWHGTAEEEMWVKGQHYPTMGPTRLPRAASGHALTLAKDQGCETETRSRRAAEQPRPAAGRRLASDLIETEHGVQSSQSSRFFFLRYLHFHLSPALGPPSTETSGACQGCGTACAALFWFLNRSFCFLFLSRRKRLSSAH